MTINSFYDYKEVVLFLCFTIGYLLCKFAVLPGGLTLGLEANGCRVHSPTYGYPWIFSCSLRRLPQLLKIHTKLNV